MTCKHKMYEQMFNRDKKLKVLYIKTADPKILKLRFYHKKSKHISLFNLKLSDIALFVFVR